MVSRTTNLVTGLIALILVFTLVIGLSHSISTGFAGFWGGLPFAVISAIVLSMVAYVFLDQCVRKKPEQESE